MKLLTETLAPRGPAAINMELLTEFLEAQFRMSNLQYRSAGSDKLRRCQIAQFENVIEQSSSARPSLFNQLVVVRQD